MPFDEKDYEDAAWSDVDVLGTVLAVLVIVGAIALGVWLFDNFPVSIAFGVSR